MFTILERPGDRQDLLVRAFPLRPALTTWSHRALMLLPLLLMLSMAVSGHVPLPIPAAAFAHHVMLADGPSVPCGGVGWPC